MGSNGAKQGQMEPNRAKYPISLFPSHFSFIPYPLSPIAFPLYLIRYPSSLIPYAHAQLYFLHPFKCMGTGLVIWEDQVTDFQIQSFCLPSNIIRTFEWYIYIVHQASSGYHCHTRLHLGFLAKLRIWQVPACKMEPRSGYISGKKPATQPPAT